MTHLDVRQLQRAHAAPVSDAPTTTLAQMPPRSDVLLLGMGNAGEAVALRTQALGFLDGTHVAAIGMNNDRLAPRPLPIRLPDGTSTPLALTERLILHGEQPRDQLHDHPLLAARYRHLLRGIPVFETYPRAGSGGHGHPVISALDIDLHIADVQAFLRRALRRLRDEPVSTPGQSHWQQRVSQMHQRQQPAQQKRILVIGGGSGSMGNAGHHLLPGLIRTLLADLGITEYELWGVILGPRTFTGLTPFVSHNYRALLEALDHMARCGQHRTYLDEVQVDLHAPAYDRVLLLDDATLPASGPTVTETELHTFLDRSALSLALLLRGTVWPTIASHLANADTAHPQEDGHLRYFATVRSVLAGVDRTHLEDLVAASLEARIVEPLLQTEAAA